MRWSLSKRTERVSRLGAEVAKSTYDIPNESLPRGPGLAYGSTCSDSWA